MNNARWVIGTVLILFGIGTFGQDISRAFVYMLIGGVVLPPTIPLLKSLTSSAANNHTPKDKYPHLTRDMIESDQPLTLTEAKKFFKTYMTKIGYYEKGDELDLKYDIDALGEDIKRRGEELKDECDEYKKQIAETKKEINNLESKLKKATEEKEQDDIKDDIGYAKDELAEHTEELESCTSELESFKKDKWDFLIEYINNETQGCIV